VPERRVELASLVQDGGHAHLGGPRSLQGRTARLRVGFHRLLVGPKRGVQAALGALDLAEVIGAPRGQDRVAGRPPPGDAGYEGTLGLRQPTALPFGSGQVPAGHTGEHPLSLVQFGQGPAGEGDRPRGVAAEMGKGGTLLGDPGRDVGQQARGPADRGLVRLIRNGPQPPLGVVQQRLHHL
jgi:hypothetical protein